MKKFRRFLILAIAALLGTVYYQRFHAMSNIATGGTESGGSTASYSSSYKPTPFGDVGGIGKVGNGGLLQQPRRQRPARTNH